jgi:segregation and condensation protein B
METARLKNILESLLFVGRKPLSLDELSQAAEYSIEALEQALEELSGEYAVRGIRIIKVAGGYLMATPPDNAEYVEKILHPKEETRLSPQALETLAIIAYKQPVTRAEIEKLRGVASDWVIETLLVKKLIQEAGRSETVGRPYLYGTTPEFLRHFGIESLLVLPPLPESAAAQETVFRSALHESSPA